MQPLRYSINVTLDGCCDHRAIPPDEDLHRHATENLARAEALLFGRRTQEMMEAAWRARWRHGGSSSYQRLLEHVKPVEVVDSTGVAVLSATVEWFIARAVPDAEPGRDIGSGSS